MPSFRTALALIVALSIGAPAAFGFASPPSGAADERLDVDQEVWSEDLGAGLSPEVGVAPGPDPEIAPTDLPGLLLEDGGPAVVDGPQRSVDDEQAGPGPASDERSADVQPGDEQGVVEPSVVETEGVEPTEEAAPSSAGDVVVRGPGTAWDLMDPEVTPAPVAPTRGPLAGGTVVEVPNPAPVYVDVASGMGGQSALSRDGTLFTWGRGAQGQLGNGTTTTNQTRPVVVNPSTDDESAEPLAFRQIERSTHDNTALHTAHYAIASDGRLYAWGSSANAKLGIVPTPSGNVTRPTLVEGVGTVLDMGASSFGGVVLTTDQRLLAWGRGAEGQLGDGTTAQRAAPAEVPRSEEAAGKTFVRVEANQRTHFALADDGTLYGWGQNNNGQLGIGNTTNQRQMVRVGTAGELGGQPIVDFATTTRSVIALGADGQVYTWGFGRWGGMGDGTSVTTNPNTRRVDMTGVMAGKEIVRVFGAGQAGYAVDTDGVAYSWGGGDWRELGNGHLAYPMSRPMVVDMTGALAGKRIVHIDGSGVNSSTGAVVALTSDGSVFSWGVGNYGEIGNGSTAQQHRPVAVHVPTVGPDLDDSTTVSFGAAEGEVVGGRSTPTLLVETPRTMRPGPVDIVARTTWTEAASGAERMVRTVYRDGFTYEGEFRPLEITQHPRSTVRPIGEQTVLESSAVGIDGIEVTWQRRAAAADPWHDVVEGVTIDTVAGDGEHSVVTRLEVLVEDQAVEYRVVYRSDFGEELVTETATVSPPGGPLGPRSVLVVTPRATMVTVLDGSAPARPEAQTSVRR